MSGRIEDQGWIVGIENEARGSVTRCTRCGWTSRRMDG